MSKMYAECDEDDKNSLNSSFWSDGEHEDEEEVEIERMVGKEALRSAEEPLLEASEEEKSDAKESKMTDEGSGGTDGDDEASCSGCDSPGLSLMTSGYGTYRPGEQEVGDCRGARLDQDSRGDLSELRDDDDEDDRRSVCSHFWFEEPGVTRPRSLSPEPAGPGAAGGDGEVKISEEGELKDDEECVLERFMMDEKIVEGGRVGGDQHERPEEEKELQQAAESDESKESHWEQDIRFIDSNVDSRSNCLKLQSELLVVQGGCSLVPPSLLTGACLCRCCELSGGATGGASPLSPTRLRGPGPSGEELERRLGDGGNVPRRL